MSRALRGGGKRLRRREYAGIFYRKGPPGRIFRPGGHKFCPAGIPAGPLVSAGFGSRLLLFPVKPEAQAFSRSFLPAMAPQTILWMSWITANDTQKMNGTEGRTL